MVKAKEGQLRIEEWERQAITSEEIWYIQHYMSMPTGTENQKTENE